MKMREVVAWGLAGVLAIVAVFIFLGTPSLTELKTAQEAQAKAENEVSQLKNEKTAVLGKLATKTEVTTAIDSLKSRLGEVKDTEDLQATIKHLHRVIAHLVLDARYDVSLRRVPGEGEADGEESCAAYGIKVGGKEVYVAVFAEVGEGSKDWRYLTAEEVAEYFPPKAAAATPDKDSSKGKKKVETPG